MANQGICSVSGCDKRAEKRTWCGMHYRRYVRAGGETKKATAASFTNEQALEFIETAVSWKSDECLIWPYRTNQKGYPIATINGRRQRLHRYVCAVVNKAPSKGQNNCCHSCDNPRCLNPRHLRWGTPKENSADMVDRGRSPKGERSGHAKLTRDDVVAIRNLRGKISEEKLASRYGVTRPTIASVMQKRTWKWL